MTERLEVTGVKVGESYWTLGQAAARRLGFEPLHVNRQENVFNS